MERTYPNYFSRFGVSDAEARERVEHCFDNFNYEKYLFPAVTSAKNTQGLALLGISAIMYITDKS